MKTFKIPFAFDDNGNAYDYQTAEKGKDYYCQCGDVVRIRGGEIVENHFYHVNKTECSNESIIHKAYKSVFEDIKQIQLPYDVNGNDLLTFDKVELEKKIDDFIPDAIGYIGKKRYLIEFAKSSYIGERKLKKIQKSNLFCIEVDIIKTCTTIDEIKEHLQDEDYYKHIIHIPEYYELKEFKEKARAEFLKLKDSYTKDIRGKQEEIHDLKLDISGLKMKVDFDKNKGLLSEGDFLNIPFHTNCKNGAKMYMNSDFSVFVHEDKLTVKRKLFSSFGKK